VIPAIASADRRPAANQLDRGAIDVAVAHLATPKIARIVGDEDEIAGAGVVQDAPILPAGLAEVGDVVSFTAGSAGDGNQVDAQAGAADQPRSGPCTPA